MAQVYDVLGVGFGPSNLALAVALSEHNASAAAAGREPVTARFFERQAGFGWHRGMLIDDATMQVSFLKDLATMRNPASEFSFLCYLHSRGRLADFINHKNLFPLRVEFHDYFEWAAARVGDLVSYRSEVVALRPVVRDGVVSQADVTVRTADGRESTHRTRNVVLATGLRPNLPDGPRPRHTRAYAAFGGTRTRHTPAYGAAAARGASKGHWMMTTRSRAAALLASVLTTVLAAGVLLTGCSGSTASSQQPGTSNAAGGPFPVTVEHKYGTTTVTSAERIVTLGLSDHEVVLALGVKPVGVVDWFKERPFGLFPWQQAKWGGTEPEIVGERDEYNVEKIAALRPDLIIAEYSGMKREQYETLSRIAPVVAQPKGFEDYAAPWQEMTRAIGKAMGRAEQAEALITGIDQKFAAVRREHPEFAGRTVIVADNYQPGTYAAFAAHDPKTLFMTEIGFSVPQVLRDAPKDQNIIDVGSEGLDMFDVDQLVWLTSDPEADARVKADPLYARLRVAGEGRDLFVPYAEPPIGASISFNTVLSIPYAIEQIVPLLAAEPR